MRPHASLYGRATGDRSVARAGTRPGHIRSRHGHGRLRTGLLTAVLAVALAACSSGSAANGVATLASESPAGASATPSASPMDMRTAMLAYADCMRSHGVNMPDPKFSGDAQGGGSGGTQSVTLDGGTVKGDPGFQAAQAACQHFMDAAVNTAGKGPTLSPEQQQAFLDFAACMRSHGVNMPDPDFSHGGVTIEVTGTAGLPDKSSQAFEAAQKACNHFIADALPSGAPGTGSSGVSGGPGGAGGSGISGGSR